MRLVHEPLLKRRGQARFADPRLAGDQYDAAFAERGLPPAPAEQLEFLIAPDEPGCGRAQGLKTADDAAFARHQPDVLRLGKASERLRPKVLELKQAPELTTGRLGDD